MAWESLTVCQFGDIQNTVTIAENLSHLGTAVTSGAAENKDRFCRGGYASSFAASSELGVDVGQQEPIFGRLALMGPAGWTPCT
jgi:hypothetical protein